MLSKKKQTETYQDAAAAVKQGTAVELIQQSAAVSAATENINNEIQKTITKLYLNIHIRKYMSLCEGCSINMLLPSNIKYTSQSIIYRKHTHVN